MPTTKTTTAYRAFDWFFALTVIAAVSGCLSINDKFQEPRGKQTQEQTTQPPLTQAPVNTTKPTNTSQPIAAETDATRGPGGDTPDLASSSSHTSESSSTNASTTTTLADSSSSSDSSSSDSSSSDSSSSDSSSSGQEPKDCLKPTICYSHNQNAGLNLLAIVDFKSYATSFPKKAGTYNVKRVEFLTGSLVGQHEIHIKESSGSDPGKTLRQASFPVFTSTGWRGVNFTPPERISSDNPRWITWYPTWNSFASMANTGITIPGRRQPRNTDSWFESYDPIMIRVYCCP